MPIPASELFAWHTRWGAFERLIPPWETLRIVERNGGVRDGARLVFDLVKGPMTVRWEALHRDYVEGRQFADEQVRGPFARWHHTHEFRELPPEQGRPQSELVDRIEYQLPGGAMGLALAASFTEAARNRAFGWRHDRTREDLVRHEAYRDRDRLRVAISGASGLVGGNLAAFLSTGGHDVRLIVRRPGAGELPEITWDPAAGTIERGKLADCDAVVHLAGESVAGSWTTERKRAIRDSRVLSTRLLAEALTAQACPPRVFICASAVGIYGDRGDETLTEDSAAGTGFLPEVCQEWEAACEPLRQAGVRVVNLRIGVVLSPRGGALQKMLTPFQMGAGGVVGSGRQYLSWIGLDDLIGVIHFSLQESALSGPVHATAPEPATNREFTRELGSVLHRPTLMPLPAFAVRAMFGEMGDHLLLQGCRALPTRLEAAGFRFLTPHLNDALRWELGLAATERD